MSYNTKQRKLILEFLKSRDGAHLTAADIVERLSQQGTRVGSATVYRFLDILEKSGDVRRFSAEDGYCYQWIGDGHCHNHYHFVCGACGGLFHVECTRLDEMFSHVFAEHSFKVDMTKTVFCGECESCAVKSGAAEWSVK